MKRHIVQDANRERLFCGEPSGVPGELSLDLLATLIDANADPPDADMCEGCIVGLKVVTELLVKMQSSDFEAIEVKKVSAHPKPGPAGFSRN